MNRTLYVIVGPTGIGKTALGIKLAQGLGGEIVSADSRQIYQGMDIGTAKPVIGELKAVPHHLIDVVPPDYRFTLAEFQDRANLIIEDIFARGKVPLLVGGTGQWVQAVTEGWGIPHVPPDLELRTVLQAEADLMGAAAFHAKLAAVDAAAAAKIDYRNVRRVIRALEVYDKTGIPISIHQKKSPPPYQIIQFGLTIARDLLYIRIDKRIDTMIAAGLAAEVEHLRTQGYGWELPSMSGLGYQQFRPYFAGEAGLDEVAAAIKRDTRGFIRRQYNWFRLDDPAIAWFDVSRDNFEAEIRQVFTAPSGNGRRGSMGNKGVV